jgi:formylglycine-generating enzyme required for sulfatase activity
MYDLSRIDSLSKTTESILVPPFEWCRVKGGAVFLKDASDHGGTKGGMVQVPDFAIAKFPVTNAQYDSFLEDPNGYPNPRWWEFSPQASQWLKDHPRPKPTAFPGSDLPRTRVNWFDSLAFCQWLSAELASRSGDPNISAPEPRDITTWCVRLPTEQEWQRAALGDTGWQYPWGDELDERRGNYAKAIGQMTSVEKYPEGKSIYGVMDMIGNTWEWCLTRWGMENVDISGYDYRVIRGVAWNVSKLEFTGANDRGEGWPPRGRLNDCGFRCGFFNDESRFPGQL